MKASDPIWNRLVSSLKRASRKRSESEIKEAQQFALTAYKMYLRGWRTNSWFLPAREGKVHDCSIYFWDEPAITCGGQTYSRARRDGWRPGKRGESLSRWFKSIWAAVAVAEKWAGR